MEKNKEKKKVPRKKKRGESPLTIIFSKKKPVWEAEATRLWEFIFSKKIARTGGESPRTIINARAARTFTPPDKYFLTPKRKKMSGATRPKIARTASYLPWVPI